MMTYRDMTFCPGDGCAQYSKCFRAFTPRVKEGAMKAGLMLSLFTEPKTLDCYLVEKTDTDIQHEPNKSGD